MPAEEMANQREDDSDFPPVTLPSEERLCEALTAVGLSVPSLKHEQLCGAAAPVPGLPPDILVGLTSSPDVSVRWLLAQNRDLPVEAMERLAACHSSMVHEALCDRDDVPPEVLDRIARHGSPSARSWAVAHPSCPIDRVMELLGDKTEVDPEIDLEVRVCDRAACNPKLSRSAILEIIEGDDERLIEYVASNLSLDREAQLLLAKKGVEARASLAANLICCEDIVSVLANDADPKVREAAARALALDHDSMGRLANDGVVEVRRALAHNACCPPEVFERVVRDPHEDVRWAAAGNEGLPPMMRCELAFDRSRLVAEEALNHLRESIRDGADPAALLAPLVGLSQATGRPLRPDAAELVEEAKAGMSGHARLEFDLMAEDAASAVRAERSAAPRLVVAAPGQGVAPSLLDGRGACLERGLEPAAMSRGMER